MEEQKILAAILDSGEAYRQVRDHLGQSDLSPQGQMWLPLIQRWYEKDDNARGVDRGLLKEVGRRTLPEKHWEMLSEYMDQIEDSLSPLNAVSDLLELKRQTQGNRLCAAIQSNDPKLSSILEEYKTLLDANELGSSEITWTMDDDQMQERLNRANLIKVAPQSLNSRCGGGAARGDHIIIFGRPEAGKTLFMVNMVCGFLLYKHKTLVVGNEEDTYKTRKRIICNLADCTGEEFEQNPAVHLAKARERGLDYLHICHVNPGSVPEIEEMLKELRPEVLVIDQIRNLEAKADSMTVKLEKLGIQVRRLLGQYDCLGVSVTQAGDKTERHGQQPPIWLTMADVDSSRTGLPAQADLIIGVGVDNELLQKNQRAISLCKNKLNDSTEGRQGFMVQIDQRKSKVR